MKRGAPKSVAAAFGLIEDGMLKGPWVMGDDYSICDPYLFTLAQWLEADGVDTAKLPRVMAHRQRMAEQPAVRKALAAESA
jgi:glutathione S-transferase